MKYFSDECDTYAAMELKDVSKEQHADGVIDDYDFDQEQWKESSPHTRMWTCCLEDLDRKKMNKNGIYKLIAWIRYNRPLWYVFLFHKKSLYSKTGKAWFMCSTEY